MIHYNSAEIVQQFAVVRLALQGHNVNKVWSYYMKKGSYYIYLVYIVVLKTNRYVGHWLGHCVYPFTKHDKKIKMVYFHPYKIDKRKLESKKQ